MGHSIRMDDRLIPAGEHYDRQVGDELVVLNIDDAAGRYFGMNPTAASIWKAIENRPCVRELCGMMAEKYDVDRASLENDVLKFVHLLEKSGLVSVERAEA